ncbi:flavin reductase family protein [Streptomyces spongiae]|uniref:Flavin reductase family protein n=1 Tax=Streptomyces spongiae TaxID=565072 RepID=A0A5N8XCG0_9ACTN|nr:flavin reductase family protein [Streptomyces spongiae]MPY57139.1 flavin reductase family protein [Streptomyces spongiae]
MSGFPTGVAVITTSCSDGEPYGLTCSSLVSVTLDPPTLLVSVKSVSPVLDAIRRNGSFAVNLLHADAEQTARIFSTPVPDRFSQVQWETSNTLHLPWLVEDSFAFSECELTETHQVGDHVLTLGRVVHAETRLRSSPLLYGMRGFAAWPTTRPDSLALSETGGPRR